VRNESLPPLAAEDHVCADCSLSYADITPERAVEIITALPHQVRAAVLAVPLSVCGIRPSPTTWSVTEYVCHLRDVYVTYTIRLHRTRVEDRPSLEPMYNDLRARRFRYRERDVMAVIDELQAAATGFCDEIARTQDWHRLCTRLPGEERTALWLVRQAAHEGLHHLADIRTTGSDVRQPTIPGLTEQ
jgi:hypothetical protein